MAAATWVGDSPTLVDLKMIRGDGNGHEFTVTHTYGAAANVTQVRFCVRTEPDGPTILALSLVDDAAQFDLTVSNACTISLIPADTDGKLPGRHWYDVEMTHTNGTTTTFQRGQFELIPDIANDFGEGSLSGNEENHGALSGLADDDHAQYILVTGTRAFTGPAFFTDGTAAAPSIAQGSDADVGLFFGTERLSFSAIGDEKIRFTHNGGGGRISLKSGGAVTWSNSPSTLTTQDLQIYSQNGGLRVNSNISLTGGSALENGHLFWSRGSIVGSLIAVVGNAAGDVTIGISGTFVVSDGAGNSAGGVITLTAPGANFNLYDDGGTNTCQLQVNANGSVGVIRTAGSRTYAVAMNLVWI